MGSTGCQVYAIKKAPFVDLHISNFLCDLSTNTTLASSWLYALVLNKLPTLINQLYIAISVLCAIQVDNGMNMIIIVF